MRTIYAAGIDRAGGVVTNRNDYENDATTNPFSWWRRGQII